MLKKRQNEVKRKNFLIDEVKKKNRSAIKAGWEDEAAIKQKTEFPSIRTFKTFLLSLATIIQVLPNPGGGYLATEAKNRKKDKRFLKNSQKMKILPKNSKC